MIPEVSCIQEEFRTTLTVSFKDGESAHFFFFPQPESADEELLQADSQVAQALFAEHHRLGLDFYDDRRKKALLVSFAVCVVLSGILAAVNLHIAIPFGFLCLLVLAFYTARWHAQRYERSSLIMQHRFLHEVRQRIYPFTDTGDFKGALRVANEMCGTPA